MFDMKSTRALAAVMGSRRDRVATIVRRAETKSERRFAGRRRSDARAFIFTPTLNEPYPCTICDQSATGARVTIPVNRSEFVTSADDIPDTFVIVIQRDRVSLDCSVAWRHGTSLGLRFTSPARLLPRTTANQRPVRSSPVKLRR